MAKRRFETLKLQIGKNGLTEAFIEQVKNIFANEERIKISILKSACRDKKQAEEICQKLVDGLGKRFTYKLVGYVATVQKWRKDMR